MDKAYHRLSCIVFMMSTMEIHNITYFSFHLDQESHRFFKDACSNLRRRHRGRHKFLQDFAHLQDSFHCCLQQGIGKENSEGFVLDKKCPLKK